MMKRLINLCTIFLLCLNLLITPIWGRELVAVGQVVGLQLSDGTVTVAAFDEELGQAAKSAGLREGDRILSIDGKAIQCAEDVRTALNESRGTVSLVLLRGSKEIRCRMKPEITGDGPKLGLYLRQGVSGVGTVTWYDPETGKFGTLGHGVNGPGGQLLRLTEGSAFQSRVVAVRKGLPGEPGQLIGCNQSRESIGKLYANLPQGVFGTTEQAFVGPRMEVAQREDVKAGAATILATVSGDTPREYSVEILKIYPKANDTGRNLLIRVTDPALLEVTGGIVQGMSGSPIIQNGKLIGAVTHVLVNDPTTGYGIFIENMLDAAA